MPRHLRKEKHHVGMKSHHHGMKTPKRHSIHTIPDPRGGKGILIPTHKLVSKSGFHSYVNQPFQNFSSAFGGTEQNIEMRLQAGRFETVHNATIHFRLGNSGSANLRLVPAPFFMTKIEFRKWGGDLIQVIYPEELWFKLSLLNHEQLEDSALAGGVSPKWWQVEEEKRQDGEYRDYYVPLLGSFFENHGGIDFLHLKDDIQVNLYLRSAISSAYTTAGTLTLSDLNLILEHTTENSHEMREHKRDVARRHNDTSTFLCCQDLSLQTQTVTASTKNTYKIEPIAHKKVPFIVVGIRASNTTVTGQNRIKFVDLGQSSASIDLETTSGESIWGRGTAIRADFLKRVIMPRFVPSDIAAYTNLYLISFSHDPAKSMAGQRVGYLHFESGEYNIAITPAAAATSGVQTISCTNASNDGGAYKLSLAGETTDSLAYNANAAAIKAAIEALKYVQEYPGGLTFTASGAATTTFTLTITEPEQIPLVQLIAESLAGGGVGEVSSSAFSTFPNRGFTTSTTSSVAIWAFYYRELTIDDGHIHVKDL